MFIKNQNHPDLVKAITVHGWRRARTETGTVAAPACYVSQFV